MAGLIRSTSQMCSWRNSAQLGKSSESAECAITGPCLHICHRPSA